MATMRKALSSSSAMASKSAVLFRVACALLLAVALVPAVALQDALAAGETTYYGHIEKVPVRGDDGLPLYADDGVTLLTEDHAWIERVETDAETLTLPSTVDLVVVGNSGEETIKDVEVSYLRLDQGDMSDTMNSVCPNLKTVDLSHCASLEDANISADSVETVVLDGSLGLKSVNLGGASLRQINGLDTLSNAKRLWITGQSGQLSIPVLTVPSCMEDLVVSGVADLTQISGLGQSQISYLQVSDAAVSSLELPKTLTTLELQNLPNYTNGSDFASLEKLQDLRLTNMSLLGAIDVPAALYYLGVNDCSGITEINGLENLKDLGYMSVTGTSVESLYVPASVGNLDVTYNHLSEAVTGPLVERFGRDSVLPQNENDSASVRWNGDPLNDIALAVGGGTNVDAAYTPSVPQWEAFDQEAATGSIDFAISAVSADEAIVSVEPIEHPTYDNAAFRVTANKVGTTTVTISFSGNSTFDDASCTFEVTVLDTENPAVGVELDEAKAVAYLFENPFSPGEQIEVAADVPYSIVPQDPTKPLTGQYDIWWADYDNTGLASSLDRVEGNILRFYPADVGTDTLQLQLRGGSAEDSIDFSLPFTVIGAMTEPALESAGSITIDTKAFVGDPLYLSTEGLSVASYTGLDANPSFSELFERCYYTQAEEASISIPYDSNAWPFITSVVSSDPTVLEVVEVDESWPYDGAKGWELRACKNGTTTLTITDYWGSSVTCDVTLTNVVESVDPTYEMKGSFTQEAYTVQVGDKALVNTVAGTIDGLEGWLAEYEDLGGIISVTSSNNNVFKICGDYLYDVSPFGFVFGFGAEGVACQPGDVTLKLVGYHLVGGPDGKPVMKETVLDTCTVHVVGEKQNLVTSIALSPADDATVELGSSLQMSAALSPADADNASDLAWSSSDETVLTVDASGKVTPVGVGTATVTAKVGEVSASTQVTVVEKAVPATGVSLTADAKTAMKAGETQQLTATVEPEDTTDKLVWSSSDEAVLTVDQSGLVTAVGNGTATITATAGGVSATTDPIAVTTPATGVKLDASSLELYAGADASKLTATVEPATASDKGVTWSSSDESVATVDAEGNVAPVGAGSATITATTTDGGFAATCAVTVRQHVEGIALDKASAAIIGKGTVELKATVAPNNASNKNVTWTSSDEGVATVDANGVVTSVGKGVATITATSEDGGKTATCSVTVSNPATKLALDPATLDLNRGDSASLSVALTGALPGAVDDCAVSVVSGDDAVATVEPAEGGAYTVKAIKTGAATVTATAEELGLTATCSVKASTPVQSVKLSETAKSVTVGDEPFSLTATVDPADADDTAVSWTSSDAKVASVAEDGTVTVHKAGKATITATAGGVSSQCSVTVAAKQVATTQEGSNFTATVEAADVATLEAIKQATPAGDSLNLVVQAIEDLTEPAKAAIESLAVNATEIAGQFDIHFESAKTGSEIVVNTNEDGSLTMTVRVALTDAMRALDPNTLTVWYVAEDGSLEKKDTWVDGDYLCFTTEHFSDYVVTGEPPAQGGQGVASGSGTGQKPAQGSPANPAALAATGDSLMVTGCAAGALALCSAAAAAVALARRRAR